ncbi:MAG: MGMT family protein [Anaerolineae bacterium]|nr:MGMT family protein [Anaerolineae bacterium]
MDKPNPFQERVLDIVRAIPRGKVLSYGQVAMLAGAPRGARQVGRILYARGRTVPWQRVINRFGGISTYKVGTGAEQRALLEKEGVAFTKDGVVDLKKHQWRPGAHIVEKMHLPEDVVFEINRKLPFSK